MERFNSLMDVYYRATDGAWGACTNHACTTATNEYLYCAFVQQCACCATMLQTRARSTR